MKIVIQGRDWSNIYSQDEDEHKKEHEKDILNSVAIRKIVPKTSDDNEKTDVSNGDEGREEPDVVAESREEEEEPLERILRCFFDPMVNSRDTTISPFNLGLYLKITKSKKGESPKLIPHSTQYVGVVPLFRNDGREEGKIDDQPVIKISSRFGISPTDMIEEVLSGMDYYEYPRMLTTKSYSMHEWRELRGDYKDEKGKVLFGLVNGIGKLDLSTKDEMDGKDSIDESDMGIVDTFGVFEIIDFVNKAKDLCRKNLKKQSQRVEENLNCKVKGRILVQKQIKYNAARGQLQKTYCAYNKMSEDIRENQIIKYALHLCQKKQGIGDALAEDIRYCMNTLRGVPLKKCCASDFVGLKNNGAYKQYKETLESAKKVIERYSTSYDDSFSQQAHENESSKNAYLKSAKVLPCFIDMNLLFEYYCRAIFRKAIDEYNEANKDSITFKLESAEYAKRLLFEVDRDYWTKYVISDEEDDNSNDEPSGDNVGKNHQYFMAKYIPDIVINYVYKDNKEKVAAIFDAKYSDVKSQPKRSRTHQVMFYMKAMGCDYGGLISPAKLKRDENNNASFSIIDGSVKGKGTKGDYEEVEVRDIELFNNHHVSDGNGRNNDDENNNIWRRDNSILYYIPLYGKKDEKDIDDIRELTIGQKNKEEIGQTYKEVGGEEDNSETKKVCSDYQVNRIKEWLADIEKEIDKKERIEEFEELINKIDENLTPGELLKQEFQKDLVKKFRELKKSINIDNTEEVGGNEK